MQTIQLAINALHAFEHRSVYCRFVCNQCIYDKMFQSPRVGIIFIDSKSCSNPYSYTSSFIFMTPNVSWMTVSFWLQLCEAEWRSGTSSEDKRAKILSNFCPLLSNYCPRWDGIIFAFVKYVLLIWSIFQTCFKYTDQAEIVYPDGTRIFQASLSLRFLLQKLLAFCNITVGQWYESPPTKYKRS